MISKNDTQSFTVRLPVELYEASTAIAQERRVSMNALIQERLVSLVREEGQKQLYDAFSLIAEDEEEMSVAFAEEAQAEVLSRDEH
ncbi:toxin-antitoxin system HicB family antitoxin [Armatimonas sp.]|uniref:toxin-antitoxin system HicB family antitoxin n=1 Tax=Armatimonas sp. TaxID=1872638 RepID=UPI00286D64A6|nr:toxin-antitoxin system HicB family antitoxin [Armatimonas sp.]